LGAYVGQELQYKFTFGSDGSVQYSGFFLDDLVIWGGGPAGEIAGQVRELGSNLPIEGADITVLEAPEVIAFTNASGAYTLRVEPGTYTVTAHKQGYCDVVQTDIVVVDNVTTTCNFSMLQPAGATNVSSINLQTTIGVNASMEFIITNPGAGCQFEYELTADVLWLTFSPDEGEVAPNGSQTVTVTATVDELPAGQHLATVSMVNNDEVSPLEFPVILEIVDHVDDLSSIPAEFAFYQNYPNPFNATTALRFDLPVETAVDIVIFNVMGQEVAHPVKSHLPAGRHRLVYTADGLPTGMYLVQMKAGEFTGLQKMMLLR
ncbi:carboxypeptidase regulatory-like domain-containing protein, partial [bacterium]|nr:carboxypeptidase regulatory-like domain-containing protein [bacterium]